MKNSYLATVAVLAGLGVGSTAKAQWVVTDPAAETNTLNTVQQAMNQLTVLNQQMQQLQQTYQQVLQTTQQVTAMQTMFTNPQSVMGMFPQLNGLHNPLPTTGAVQGQILGITGLQAPGSSYYNSNHIYTSQGSDPYGQLINKSGISIANIQGMAQANLQSIEMRLSNINAMETELSNATDIHQVDAINGRIAIESHAVQAQQVQAQNLDVMASAQMQARQQAQNEIMRKGYEDALATYTVNLP